jgi:hypothetical protein
MMNVEELIAAYGQAFEAHDADAAAALWAYPAHVTTDLGGEVRLTVVPDAPTFLPMLRALMEKYRRDGVKRVRALSLDVKQLSPRLCQVSVHWGLLGLADLPLYDFDNVYTVARVEQEWKVVSAVSPNELPRYRAFIGRG